MSANPTSPLEVVLRTIDQANPQPIFPREFAAKFNIPADQVLYLIEHLWLDGLLERTPVTDERGVGLKISPLGQQVLGDPVMLQRLREGKAIVEGDRGGTVRETLRREGSPVVIYALLALNVLVFLYSLNLASKVNAGNQFLSFFPSGGAQDQRVLQVIHDSGALHITDLVQGEWWRLLTSCFVHIGLMHLVFNMWVLYSAGKQGETMWGPVRFAVIYLLSGLGGSLFAGTWHFAIGGGASGALCGIIASEGVWFLLNKNYLPRGVVRRFAFGFLITAGLLLLISLYPGVSWQGHLGGAGVGAGVGALLNVHRFGTTPLVRLGALVPIVLAPLWGYLFADYSKKNSAYWQEAVAAVAKQKRLEAARKKRKEINSFQDDALPLIRKALKKTRLFREETLEPTLEKHPTRREVDAIAKAKKEADQVGSELTSLQTNLGKMGPFLSETVEEARNAAQLALKRQAAYLKMSVRCLDAGEKWSDDDDKELRKVRRAADFATREYYSLLE